LQELDGKPELDDELALFNKVGDLYQKAGNVQSAVEMWERGVDHYVEGGFHNNGIALCNKILRNAPGRTHVYLRLAQLMVQRGFVSEAKQNLLEYAERMKKAGQLDAAFKALKEFADLSPDNEEIRLLLAEQLKAAARTDEAREQLAKLYHETKERQGEPRARATLDKMKVIDPEFNAEAAPAPKTKDKREKSSELVFLDLDEAPAATARPSRGAPRPAAPPPPRPAAKPAAPAVAARPPAVKPVAPPPKPAPKPAEPPPLEFEPTSLVEEVAPPEEAEELPVQRAEVEFDSTGVESGTMEGLMGTAAKPPEAPPLEFEPTALEEPVAPELPVDEELPVLEVPEVEAKGEAGGLEVPELDLGGFGEAEAAAPGGGAELMDLEIEVEPFSAAPPAGPPDVATLESQVASNPDDAQLHQTLGEALLETGQRDRGLQELDIALGLFEGKEDWSHAEDLTDEILRLDPNSVRHYQKQVEYAFRRNDKTRLVEAYLGLSDALMRSGSLDRARAVYQRVLEHDPKNQRALSALSTLEPPPEEKKAAAGPRLKAGPPIAAPGDFVDLGALILEDEGPRDARLRVQDEEPTGDEQRDFEDMLAQFKKGIDASLGADDVQAHYDLGIAFKEMGLVDEAIGEFQKALRGTEGRLRTSEALGTCFFEKGQFNVAATVLRRAVDTDPGGDDAKVGLLYWLGRAEEEQGHSAEALSFYQRVFAVDIGFQDVSDRVKSLAKAGR
jgi:tetratricopeptide (TPR) repeat protein